MHDRGLVSRTRCLTDQRGAVIAINSRGRDLMAMAAPQHADVRDVLIDHLTATELETLATIGDKVHDRLGALERGSGGYSPAGRSALSPSIVSET